MTLPIGEPDAAAMPSGDSGRIRAALGHLPVPVGESTPVLVQEWNQDTWSVRAPGATSLTFIPDETCVPLADLISQGTSTTERLSVRIAPPAPEGARISGILAVSDADGSSSYRIDTPLPKIPA